VGAPFKPSFGLSGVVAFDLFPFFGSPDLRLFGSFRFAVFPFAVLPLPFLVHAKLTLM
jgi:hypothetical protein